MLTTAALIVVAAIFFALQYLHILPWVRLGLLVVVGLYLLAHFTH